MKIVEAINSMITNSDKITDVIQNGPEFYFMFNNKYKWSIRLNESGNYTLFLYPKDDRTLNELASFSALDFSDYTDYVTYSSKDIKTREAEESFANLYQIVGEKIFGADDILDAIINLNV